MNSVPTNNYTFPDDTNHPSLPPTPRQLETQDNEAPTFLNDLLSNYPPDFGDFNVNTGTPRVPSHGTLPRHVDPLFRRRLVNIRRRRHARPGTIPQGSPSQATFGAPPQANILATVAPQLTSDPFDGAYTHPSPSVSAGLSSPMFDSGVPRCRGVLIPQVPPQSANFNGFPQPAARPAVASQPTIDVFGRTSDPITDPSASRPSGSSSAGTQLSLSGIQNIPMTSGLVPAMVPALASSSSLTQTTSVSPTPESLVRSQGWNSSAASMGSVAFAGAGATTTTATTTSMRAEPRRVPVFHCSCCQRLKPLVRVDDAIEWVRPDVMKMTLWINWSSNAEAEAHGSWEPRGA
ncbi:hypothetical protein DFH94DRAFT_773739 [Russula ochroleuca]|jgi:hypothetical protein|uniref:Uncharacterized protein n=1 Tax=Russula ochroleuca TaxID=152965 RepID=A0A9P5JX59_9AGAM|nr:hypothetical protein DFH94DRAFT_773739 [Russula ochroleuca]